MELDGKSRPGGPGTPKMMGVQVNLIVAPGEMCAGKCYGIVDNVVVMDCEFQGINAQAVIAGLRAIVNEISRRGGGIAIVGAN